MRRVLPAVLLAIVAFPAADARAADTTFEVRDGPARIQVLTPTLFRLEFAADERFEDAPTLTAIRRGPTRGKVRTRVVDGLRVVKTSRAILRYRIGAGPFDASNLKLTMRGDGEKFAARPSFPTGTTTSRAPDPPPVATLANPGDPAPRTQGNLGGWYRGLDGQSGPVPLHDGILSRDGWYLLDDTISPLLVDGGRWYAPRPGHSGGYQDGYLFAYAHDYAAALGDFRDLSGPAPLLPREAFGNWFSRYSFYSASAYQKLVARFRAAHVPLDVLIVDTDYKAPNPWNGWQWTPVFGPDPAGFLKWAHSKELAVGLNVHPSITHADPAFAAADAAAGGLPTDSGRCQIHVHDTSAVCGVWDWARPEHVKSYFSLHEPFEAQGVDFWWLDWNNDESDAQAPGLTPDTWINALYAGRERARGLRWLALSRVGSSFWNYHAPMPGAWADHRYAIHFTGDTYPTWPMLDFQIRFTAAEGAGIGLPYVSHDIGSFHGEKLPSDMYVRWIQFGTFQPILRLHSDHGYRLPWEYGKRASRIASGFLRLRESLVPYLYTLARKAYDSGLPMARPMYLSWPRAQEAYEFDGQYMLGDQLLVAPVAAPGKRAAKRVWFPPGEWVDVFTGAVHRGGRTERMSVPLDRMPVFARAGSVVPRQPSESRVAHGQADPLALDVYTGDSGSFELYEDSGAGFEYERGAFTRTSVRWGDGARTLTIGGARGHYGGMPAKRRYLLRFVGVRRPSRMTISSGGQPRELHVWSYDPALRRLDVPTGAVSARNGATVRLELGGSGR